MRAPISVVIPTLNSQPQLGMCLESLMQGVEAGLIRELIVSDGGSNDATVELAKAWGAEIIEGAASRGGQLRRGSALAEGRWMLILHADTTLDADWVGAVVEHMETGRAGWFQLAFERGGCAGKIVSAWANLRSRFGLPYGDQGLFLPARLYEAVGGYADQPLMEDVAIARALRGQLSMINAVARTSAVRYKRQGWLRRGFCNIWTLARYFGGVSPHELSQTYRS